MQSTKHDLSHDSTKLDFNALLRTAGIAYSLTREELNRNVHKLFNLEVYGSEHFSKSVERNSAANEIKRLADMLAVASETYSALEESLRRSELTVIEKPEVDTTEER